MRHRLLGLFLLLSALGQAQQPASYIAQQYQITLQNPPQMVANATVQRTGNPGASTFYYWIVARTLVGNATPAGPFQATQAPNSLDGSNFLTIIWSAPSNATSYDVLRTTQPIMPVGSCSCAVATGVSTLSTTDQSNSLSGYTVSTLDPNTLTLALTNEGNGIQNGSALTLRINGVLTPIVSSSISTKTCQITFGADNASPLATADIQPQRSLCKVEAASTVNTVIVLVDAGASTVQVGYRNNGSTTALTGVLTPVTVGGITDKVACANTTGGGIIVQGNPVTCSILTNTALPVGVWIETIGGVADGTTHRASIATTFIPN